MGGEPRSRAGGHPRKGAGEPYTAAGLEHGEPYTAAGLEHGTGARGRRHLRLRLLQCLGVLECLRAAREAALGSMCEQLSSSNAQPKVFLLQMLRLVPRMAWASERVRPEHAQEWHLLCRRVGVRCRQVAAHL